MNKHKKRQKEKKIKLNINKWLKRDHDGDCVKQPSTCLRCLAEKLKHK